MRILVVDDEPAIIEAINQYVSYYNHQCDGVGSGYKAIEMVKNNDYDVIVMDVMMPDLDGYQTTKKIKEIKPIPVLMLSARGLENDKLYGFEVGADDYLTKPFSVKELLARLNAISVRNSVNPILAKKDLVIDTLGRKVMVKGKEVLLTPKEYELLVYMFNHEKQVLTRQMLLDAVWSDDFYGDVRTVDTHIKMLRKNCNEIRHYFVTIRGVGYKFEVV